MSRYGISLCFLVKDFERTFRANAKFSISVKRTRWRTRQHVALWAELAVVAWAKKNLVGLRPIHGTGKMRAATVEDQQIFGVCRLADDKTTVTGGGSLPAVD